MSLHGQYGPGVPTDALNAPLMQQLLGILRQRGDHRMVDGLTGYDATATGTIAALGEVAAA
jgi:hypothetical protein